MYKMSTPERPIRIFISIFYSFVGFLLAALIIVHQVTKIPFNMFTADPAASMQYNSFYGYISNVGILFWCATATVCFLSGAVLNIRKDQREIIHFLVCFGALTMVLMFDDLFMFHESIAPWVLHVPEKATLVVYGLYAAFCFARFHKVILTNDFRYLFIAIAAFGTSVVIDQISEKIYFPGEYLFEDGAKFIGIASWLVYFVDFSYNKMMSVLAVSQIEIIRGKRSKRSGNEVLSRLR